MDGYIKLHRKMIGWEWYQDANTCRVFLHCLLSANHEEKRWMGIDILPGQFITSSTVLAKELGLSRQNVRTSLTKLKSTSEITIKSTNRFLLVSIDKWASYQTDAKKSTSKITTDRTINQPTTNQQLTTNKNEKNEKNVRNIDSSITLDLSFILDDQVRASFAEFVEYRKSIKKTMQQMTAEKAYKGLVKLTKNPQEQIDIIDNAIAKGWQGLYPIKSAASPQATGKSNIGNFEGRQYTAEDYASMYEDPPQE